MKKSINILILSFIVSFVFANTAYSLEETLRVPLGIKRVKEIIIQEKQSAADEGNKKVLIKALLFDLQGTLAPDLRFIAWEALAWSYCKYVLKEEPDSNKEALKKSEDRINEEKEKFKIDSGRDRVPVSDIRDRLGITKAQQAEGKRIVSVEKLREKLKPDLQIIEVLRRLNEKYYFVLVTNENYFITKIWLECTKLDEFFEDRYIITQDRAGAQKPDTRIYQTAINALNKFGISAEECVSVGDMREQDGAPALKLGMRFIEVKNPQDLAENVEKSIVSLSPPVINETDSDEKIQKTTAKEKLKKAFEQKQPVIISCKNEKWKQPSIVMFDMDGVITIEKDYFEKAWAVLVRRLLKNDPRASLSNITEDDFNYGAKFRAETKGGLLAPRINLLKQRALALHKAEELPDIKECSDIYLNALRSQILSDYSDNFERYLLPGARRLLTYLKEIYDMPLCLVTANLQFQAEWVTKKLNIDKFFTKILGYPLDPKPVDKTVIITDLLKTFNITKSKAIFIGDGYSDVRFGRTAGVITVGIANDYKNGCRLIDEGVNFIVINTDILNMLSEELFPAGLKVDNKIGLNTESQTQL